MASQLGQKNREVFDRALKKYVGSRLVWSLMFAVALPFFAFWYLGKNQVYTHSLAGVAIFCVVYLGYSLIQYLIYLLIQRPTHRRTFQSYKTEEAFATVDELKTAYRTLIQRAARKSLSVSLGVYASVGTFVAVWISSWHGFTSAEREGLIFVALAVGAVSLIEFMDYTQVRWDKGFPAELES
ncbi:MAG: hypothetical protein KGZ89_00060 [Actinobacteria bacterium]|nr:hypothetical protein [Actinomycetota bacterium]